MINPVSSPAYTPVSSASKGADVAMNKAEMSTAQMALGAQTNVMKAAMEIEGHAVMNISSSAPSVSAPQPAQTSPATPAKKAQATQGENIINILKNVFDVRA